MTGHQLPTVTTEIPGPRSRELAKELRRYECAAITFVGEEFPVFWESASGANVRDVDGNIYVDTTAGFGVATLGHSRPEIVEAAQEQTSKLTHGLGDVHPSAAKVELARLLSEVTPGNLGHAIFSSSGSESVEAALKTAMLATGRSKFIAFEGGYHGLTFGALSMTHRTDFREPFEARLGIEVVHLPYPDPYRPPYDQSDDVGRLLVQVAAALEKKDIAAIVVEPIQGRGGEVVPPDDFLPGLRELCDQHGTLLIADEIFTGFCRTGEWFAVDHVRVVPDLMCIGKAMSNGFPISACVGRPEVMAAWGESQGEAIHTSTFLGHPVGCAAAIRSIRLMQEEALPEVCAEKGDRLLALLAEMQKKHPEIGDVRGRGLLIGVECVHNRETKEPAPDVSWQLVLAALKRGYLLLGGGARRNVISISPPATITDEQMLALVDAMDECLEEIG
ncbi:MAG: aspartate aminotransferase family protein [Planctomycetota bacterium]|jgi:4-aminobutyrate aminotransferase-like enzyme|nr:aspartate aminotransferase family protein [Planctomycetota bacterium]